ncbi:FAD-binding oxidoreductase [Nocardioides sp. zg-1228]|uniref:NAD(P)/FAD-dependent oxidoreductase n=1 Tax=Nocardioides sp. zg-1228 TaxID=2763008 RepID=UPI0016426BD6|nr:FAD-dependent oxidoreductase [Nocardioides sp. zg-1228]MBC2934275.1 FAD-binding oxidoreductase [Nocardioides sp. zg-1228]QSF59054.1 FAD-binding oxidoreductase [Nocardioides sp. zg-1228]
MTKRVAIVGAGMVGLSTGWFLQEHGFHVTVHERRHVAGGSSWGNAGWLTPSLTAPLPEPAVLTYGVRAVLSPSSPVYLPPRLDPRLARFLAGFVRHSTARRWGIGMRAYAPMNRQALAAFDELATGGVEATTRLADPFLACFRTAEERAVLVEELEHVRSAGQDVTYDVLSGSEARALEPSLTAAIGGAVVLHGQRYLDPPAFLAALADSFVARGGEIRESSAVTDVRQTAGGALVTTDDPAAGPLRYDAVVLANGAWIGTLARRFGVRQPVQAGRGYSFSVGGDRLPETPVYFPAQRVACTPLPTADGPRLRVAGMMEFRDTDAPLDPRRIEAIVEATRPLFDGIDLDDRRDEWVGARPCTPDGLPLIGATDAPDVFVAGGHGMWGIALGPLTGRLLARRIATGATPAELVAFDPLR